MKKGLRKIQEIDIKKINLDTAQPRGESKIDQLKDLAKDIKERGLLYPIIVTPYYKKGETLVLGKKALESKERKWWVLDGERRVRAFKILKQDTIEAIIQLEIEFLKMLEIQFAANTKRVQITVEEMAKAIKRFKVEYLKKFPKKDPLARLVELTGYSYSYFDMAEAINRAPLKLQEKIEKGETGGYTAAEIEHATKDVDIRRGVTNAYIKSKKPMSALAVRAVKEDLRVLEKKKNLTPKEKEKLSESILTKYFNKGSKDVDENSDFLRYRHEAENFLDEIKLWNLEGITVSQIDELICIFDTIKNYFVEERRNLGKMKKNKKSKNIGK